MQFRVSSSGQYFTVMLLLLDSFLSEYFHLELVLNNAVETDNPAVNQALNASDVVNAFGGK